MEGLGGCVNDAGVAELVAVSVNVDRGVSGRDGVRDAEGVSVGIGVGDSGDAFKLHFGAAAIPRLSALPK